MQAEQWYYWQSDDEWELCETIYMLQNAVAKESEQSKHESMKNKSSQAQKGISYSVSRCTYEHTWMNSVYHRRISHYLTYSQATHEILVCIVTFSALTCAAVLRRWIYQVCSKFCRRRKLCVNSIIKVLIIPLSVQVKYVEWLVENFQNKYCKNLIKWSVICNTLGITSLHFIFYGRPKIIFTKTKWNRITVKFYSAIKNVYETVFGDCKQISAHTEVLKWNQRKKRKIGKGATKVGRICCAYMWDGENWSECAEGYFIEMDISGMELIANICKSNFLGRNMAKEVNWKSLICVWENSRCASKRLCINFMWPKPETKSETFAYTRDIKESEQLLAVNQSKVWSVCVT